MKNLENNICLFLKINNNKLIPSDNIDFDFIIDFDFNSIDFNSIVKEILEEYTSHDNEFILNYKKEIKKVYFPKEEKILLFSKINKILEIFLQTISHIENNKTITLFHLLLNKVYEKYSKYIYIQINEILDKNNEIIFNNEDEATLIIYSEMTYNINHFSLVKYNLEKILYKELYKPFFLPLINQKNNLELLETDKIKLLENLGAFNYIKTSYKKDFKKLFNLINLINRECNYSFRIQFNNEKIPLMIFDFLNKKIKPIEQHIFIFQILLNFIRNRTTRLEIFIIKPINIISKNKEYHTIYSLMIDNDINIKNIPKKIIEENLISTNTNLLFKNFPLDKLS